MTAPFWFVASAFALEVVFGLMPEVWQPEWDTEKIQAQNVILGFAALTALSYRSPIGKGMILLATVWATWVLATDWILPRDWPSWIPAAEGAFFLACLLWLWWADAHVSRGEETGLPTGDDVVPDPRTGERRSPGGKRLVPL